MRRPLIFAQALAVSLAFGAAVSTPSTASAGGERWQELVWVYASPGLLAVPLAQDGLFELDATWQWSVGAGYMIQPLEKLWIIPGGSFEHMILNPDATGLRGSQFRIQPEARIGGGFDRLFIYGLVGIGLDLTHIRVVTGSGDTREVARRTHAGFNTQIGAGALFNVWDALSIGGELDADLSFNRRSGCDVNCGFRVHTLGIKAMVGYQF